MIENQADELFAEANQNHLDDEPQVESEDSDVEDPLNVASQAAMSQHEMIDICTICHSEEKDKWCAAPCGHTACKDCLTTWERDNANCFLCRSPMVYIHPVIIPRRKRRAEILQEEEQLAAEERARTQRLRLTQDQEEFQADEMAGEEGVPLPQQQRDRQQREQGRY